MISLPFGRRFTDLDCLADGHQYLVKDCVSGDRNSILLLRKGTDASSNESFNNLIKVVHERSMCTNQRSIVCTDVVY